MNRFLMDTCFGGHTVQHTQYFLMDLLLGLGTPSRAQISLFGGRPKDASIRGEGWGPTETGVDLRNKWMR